MKIEVMKIIQNVLIGGRNGEMAFVYNNEFVRGLYDNYEYNFLAVDGTDYEEQKFKSFLIEVLKQEDLVSKKRENKNSELKITISSEKIKNFVSDESYSVFKQKLEEYKIAQKNLLKEAELIADSASNSLLSSAFSINSIYKKIRFELKDCNFYASVPISYIGEAE